MIKIGSQIKIKYSNGVIQNKVIISLEYYRQIRANLMIYLSLKDKDKKHYKEKISLDFDEVVEASPMGSPMMGKDAGDVVIMQLPPQQGGEHKIEILSVENLDN